MSKVNIFVINNTYSLFLAEKIASSLNKDFNSLYFIGNANELDSVNQVWNNTTNYKIPENHLSIFYSLKDLNRNRKILKAIIKEINLFDQHEFYITNINNTVTNHVFFFLATNELVNNISEGTLTYRPRNFKIKNILVQFIKAVFGLFSYIYNPFFIDSLALENRKLKKIYTLDNSDIYGNSEIVEMIEIDSSDDPKLNPNICLVLCQHILHEMDSSIKEECLELLKKIIDKGNYRKIFFKTHPRINNVIPLESKIVENYTLVTDNISAENYFETIKPYTVISIGGSSSFIYWKKKYAKNIRCVAVGMDTISIKLNSKYSQLIKKFIEINVEIYK